MEENELKWHEIRGKYFMLILNVCLLKVIRTKALVFSGIFKKSYSSLICFFTPNLQYNFILIYSTCMAENYKE